MEGLGISNVTVHDHNYGRWQPQLGIMKDNVCDKKPSPGFYKEGREGKEKREESCIEEGRGASLFSGLKMDLPFFRPHVQSLTNFFPLRFCWFYHLFPD